MAEAVPVNQVIQRLGGLFARASRAFGATAGQKAIDPTELKGLSALSRSIPSSTLATRPSESSWLFQAPSLTVSQLGRREYDLNFDSILTCASHFKDLSAELFEALLWEPLFSGHVSRTTCELETLQLSLFGGRLWYRDLVVVPMLRDSAPTGEILVSPNFRSEANFHIYRAFTARGYTDQQRNVELFAKLFEVGPQTGRVDRFQAEVRAHYNEGDVIPRGLAARLSLSGYWRDFLERFLVHEGLPSLLTSELTREFSGGSISEYITGCHQFLKNGLTRVPQSTLAKVRARREIQQRGLQALQILNALKRQNFVAERRFDVGYACAALEMYLEILTDALKMLIEKGAKANSLIRNADAYYAENLCGYFGESQIRARLFEPRDMLKFALEGLDFFNQSRPSSRLLEYAIGAARGSDVRKMAEHELVRDTWSLPLSHIDPRAGVFGEIFPRKEVV